MYLWPKRKSHRLGRKWSLKWARNSTLTKHCRIKETHWPQAHPCQWTIIWIIWRCGSDTSSIPVSLSRLSRLFLWRIATKNDARPEKSCQKWPARHFGWKTPQSPQSQFQSPVSSLQSLHVSRPAPLCGAPAFCHWPSSHWSRSPWDNNSWSVRRGANGARIKIK